ncbi:hypothetical protein [Parasphingorhabdus sp.]|uniref:hypothetical protein n=1 Tax=Parasphingorhabdus sp. TaxID=2709688 RepID=UPI002F957B69
MTMFYSAQTGGFYDDKIHEETLPDDVVSVAISRHSELMEDQSAGATIGTDPETGAPVSVWPEPLSLPAAIDIMRLRTKAEAERRIIIVSPIFRQMNDLRAAQVGEIMSPDAAARFTKIDEIRVASDAIEAEISAMTDAGAIMALDLVNHPSWPESD